VAVLARTLSDEAVIQGFLAGEGPGAASISTWIHEVLRHRRFGLGSDAEDVAQQVRRNLIVAFRDGRFAGHASLRTYVWRVAQHAAIDHLRAQRVKPETVCLDAVAEAAHPAASPEQAALRRERRDVFARILAGLDEGCRDLFHLIVFEELSYAEVARRLRATEGAIKVRALRCREKAAAEYASVTSGRDHRPLKEEDV
jgi:RNA polymerase sigma factor (sigma-70 family)